MSQSKIYRILKTFKIKAVLAIGHKKTIVSREKRKVYFNVSKATCKSLPNKVFLIAWRIFLLLSFFFFLFLSSMKCIFALFWAKVNVYLLYWLKIYFFCLCDYKVFLIQSKEIYILESTSIHWFTSVYHHHHYHQQQYHQHRHQHSSHCDAFP